MKRLPVTVKSKAVKRNKSVLKNKRIPKSTETSLIDINIPISIINDVTDNDDLDNIDLATSPVSSGLKLLSDKDETDYIYAKFAILFKNPHTIMIPTKAKRLIEKYLPRPILDKIHGGEKTTQNRKVAIELCLLFLSQLSSTHRNILNGKNPDGWKDLRAEYLRQLLRIDDQTYQRVKTALKFEYEKGPILEDRFYVAGLHSYQYRLGSAYRSKGFVPYELQTEIVRKLFKNSCARKLKKAQQNVICVNLIEFYKTIVLPTEKEIEDEADRLIKEGYQKKGKKLARRNKRSNAYFSNVANLSFVEDALKVYQYLTKNGLMIPRPGNGKSGGRIVDSFVLMPSWIRRLIKIDGKPIAEADYSCLHPNLVMSLYNGSGKFIKHKDLCTVLGIDELIVKKEHLSFFNKRVGQMKNSPLFDYYIKYESSMIDAVMLEKTNSEYEHKITSRRLFAKEVEMMTEAIKRLNAEGIFVGYIYDALFFDPANSKQVVDVMDEVAADFGVFTTAKLEK
jgi:hypothetical protein